MNDHHASNARRTRDHVVPRWMGGRLWVWCCLKCNGDKCQFTIAHWLKRLEDKGDPRAPHVRAFMEKKKDAIEILPHEYNERA